MLFAFFCVYTVPVFAAGTVQDGSTGFSIENPLAVKSICGLIQKLLLATLTAACRHNKAAQAYLTPCFASWPINGFARKAARY